MAVQDSSKSKKNLSAVTNTIKSNIGHNLTDKERQNQYSLRSNASSPNPDLDVSTEISDTQIMSVHPKDSTTRQVSVKQGGKSI